MKAQKTLAALLSSAMVLGTMAVPVFADGNVAEVNGTEYATLADAVAAANSGDTITLLNAVKLSSTVEITKDLTIDIAGNQIEAWDARALWVKSGDVKIINSSVGGSVSADQSDNGTFDSSSSVIRVGDNKANTKAAKLTIDQDVTVTSSHCYGVTVFGLNDTDNNKATSDIEFVLNYGGSVSVSGSQAAISGNGTKTNSATKMTINGSVYTMNNEEYAIYHPGKGTLTINDNAVVWGYGGIEAKAGKVIINGGEIIADAENQGHTPNYNGASTSGYAIAAVNNNSYAGEPTTTIKGGNINGEVAVIDDDDNDANNNAKISITGGTFTSDVQNYLAKGYTEVVGNNNTVDRVTNMSELLTGPVTIKSAVNADKGTYEQVTATTVDASADEKVFTIKASGADNWTQNVTLTGITVSGEGEILCGLLVTDIPDGVTITIE